MFKAKKSRRLDSPQLYHLSLNSFMCIEPDAFAQVVVLVAFFEISGFLDTRDHFQFLIG